MKKYIAEFMGTFILVFVGTSAIVINDISGGVITHIGIAIVFGLVVAAMIYAVGDISGAHINPAVTVGFWYAGHIPGKEASFYIISQLLGALTASIIVYLVFSGHPTLGATLPSGSWAQSFTLEIILTFILMFTIITIATGAKEKRIMAGVAIGTVIGLGALFAGPVSGASMNPARSLAPAIVSGNTAAVWIYIFAPLLGAGLAIICCRCRRGKECCKRHLVKSRTSDRV